MQGLGNAVPLRPIPKSGLSIARENGPAQTCLVTATPPHRMTLESMAVRRVFPSVVRGRRSVRLRGHEYRSGTYFVTICTHDRVPTFGEVVQGRVHLSPAGRIARMCWLQISRFHAHVTLDAFVVMPDHIHGILRCVDPPALTRTRRFGDAVPGSLSTILGTYKAEVTKRVNALRRTPGKKIWQRNYYEHVVRRRRDLDRIRWYIATNPRRWTAVGTGPKT